MAKPGRKPIAIDLEEVEALASTGLTQYQIADALGIHLDTLMTRKRKDPEFAAAVKRGQAKGIAKVSNALFQSAFEDKNVTAQIFYLKARAGWSDKPPELPPNPDEGTPTDDEFL